MSTSKPKIPHFLNCPSNLKIQLAAVIKNIKTLKAHEAGNNVLGENELLDLKTQITLLLDHLENVPIEKFKKKLTKRRSQRKRRKIKKNQHKVDKKQKHAENQNINYRATLTSAADTNKYENLEGQHPQETDTSTDFSFQPFCMAETLRMLREQHRHKVKEIYVPAANEKTVDKLGNPEELFQPKAAKSPTLKKQMPEERQGKSLIANQKSTRTRPIEDQWDEVLFGARHIPCYRSKLAMNDFIRIRNTWDTYLTRNKKYGSSIPSGWVLPKEDAAELWQNYKSTTSN